MTTAEIVLIAPGTLIGLLAGLFYAFSVSVIPGLLVLPPKLHIKAMQAINVKIQNPVFIASFLAPTILLPLATFLHQGSARFGWLLIATVVYIVGVNAVTIIGNVPLNNALDSVNADALADADAERIRQEYHGAGARWMLLHTIRTLAAIAATVLLFAGALAGG